MTTLREKIKELCKEKGVSMRKVENDLGFGAGYLSKLDKSSPTSANLNLISDYFGISYEDLAQLIPSKRLTVNFSREAIHSIATESIKNNIDIDLKKIPHRHLIPVLGYVAAGLPIEAAENIIDWEEISDVLASTGEFFALKIKGDSMEPKMSDGDVIITRKQNSAEEGDYVVVLINGHEATCKRLKRYGDGVALISLNPIYEPMYFTAKDVETLPVNILGVVKELRAKF